MVQTGILIPQVNQMTTETRKCSRSVLWACEPKKWAKALQKVTEIAMHQGLTLREATLKMQAIKENLKKQRYKL